MAENDPIPERAISQYLAVEVATQVGWPAYKVRDTSHIYAPPDRDDKSGDLGFAVGGDDVQACLDRAADKLAGIIWVKYGELYTEQPTTFKTLTGDVSVLLKRLCLYYAFDLVAAAVYRHLNKAAPANVLPGHKVQPWVDDDDYGDFQLRLVRSVTGATRLLCNGITEADVTGMIDNEENGLRGAETVGDQRNILAGRILKPILEQRHKEIEGI